MGYSPWGHKESDLTESLTHTQTHTVCLISHKAKTILKKKGIFPLFHVSTPYTSRSGGGGAGFSLQMSISWKERRDET